MTVEELIQHLRTRPQDAQVFVFDADAEGETQFVPLVSILAFQPKKIAFIGTEEGEEE